ncbi:MAG: terminase large subunit [Pirellulaceae bacterium]
MILRQLQANPAVYQADLHVPTGSGPRRFGDVMADFQRERFALVNPSLVAVTKHEPPPVPRVWDERTKGASKDTDAAVNLLWLLAFSRRPLRIQVGAYDQSQADEVRLITKGIVRTTGPLNNFLAQVIDVQSDKIVNKRTDSTCEILTSDKLGSHGSRPDVVLLDELTHQKDKAFAETLLDNLDKMPCGLAIIATNAGHDPSWQLDWKRTFAASDRWRILEYNQPAPWITASALAESAKRNSAGRYARLWKGQWVSDTGDALDASDIDNCFTRSGPMLGDEPGYVFAGGLDIGLKKHATGFVVVGKHIGWSEEKPKPPRVLSDLQRALIENGHAEEPIDEPEYAWHEPTHRLRLAHLKAWKPTPGKRVSLEAVRVEILRAQERFNLAGISLDPHQGEHLAELLQRDGVPIIPTPQTPNSLQEQATTLVEAFQQRTIELYPDDDLAADLKTLRIQDKGTKVRLLSPEKKTDDGAGTAHGDLASALSFALVCVKNPLIGSIYFSYKTGNNLIVYP